MAKSNKSKYYVVWVGQNPGIYDSWQKCQEQIKGFPNAKYKSFKSLEEAKAAFGDSAFNYMNTSKSSSASNNIEKYLDEIVKDSISVDAACSGNPGLMEYRCVETLSKKQIFLMGPFEDGTNNVGEYLALVHALAMLDKMNNTKTAIYTDSKTAMSWIRNKKVKTTLKQTAKNKKLFVLLKRASHWVEQNKIRNKIIKWDTKRWGEIPADFGRK